MEQKKWLDLIVRIQSLAQAGLAYGKDRYDIERFEELRDIAAQMMAAQTDLPLAKVKDLFCNEQGYQTPKIDTRAAVFQDGRILLVRENTGKWALPGGWCDVDQSVASNTIKEVQEEAGYEVSYERLIAIEDWRRHNHVTMPYGIMKIFSLCRLQGGSFQPNIETTEARFFARHELPAPLAVGKTTEEQIAMCFAAHDDPHWQPKVE